MNATTTGSSASSAAAPPGSARLLRSAGVDAAAVHEVARIAAVVHAAAVSAETAPAFEGASV
ncbi:MAG TPA: hypothetical protein VK824_10125 [Planctomycetota bacterium]|nr:hypothetical protein [Planctomycetota bacterium]